MSPEFALPSGARLIAIIAVVALALGIGVLAVVAYQRANPTVPPQSAAPVPTFTLGVQTQTPTPTPTPVIAAPREAERFLSAASGTLWRGVAGSCGGAAPLIERSNDGGASWTDVTPLYVGLAQIASLDGLAVDAAEAVGAVGPECEPQALRSYTNGRFWESYPDVLAISRFVALNDTSVVQLPTGPVDSPCANARGLRALSSVVALVCDGVAYAWTADTWSAMPAPAAVTLAISGSDVLIAHRSDDCAGLALTRFVAADPAQPVSEGCAEGVDPTSPAAIAASGDETLVWSGDAFLSVP